MTIASEALKILSNVEDFIFVKDLVNQVEEVTNSTKDTIRGSLFTSKSAMIKKKEFLDEWVNVQSFPHRKLVRKGKLQKGDVAYKVNYNTEEKDRARLRGVVDPLLDYVKENQDMSPYVLTLAAEEGLCVERVLNIFPKAKITNVEYCDKVLKKYEKNNFPTTNIKSSIEKFVEKDDLNYYLFNLDLTGPACKGKMPMFETINRKNTIDTVVITLQHSKRWRGDQSRPFVKEMEKKYGKYDDQVLAWITDIFYNYNLHDSFKYKRDSRVNSTSMRMFIFKQKSK